MEKYIILIAVLLIQWPFAIAWCGEVSPLPEDKPITATTGIRTGCVTDAITGKPIEDAIVVYNWDIRDFSFEGGSTRFGAVYETVAGKDGKYAIPSRSVKIEHSAFSHLDPEQVFVYKPGYVWYWMVDKELRPFLAYLPDLPHIYRKQNNVVKLQPWNNEMSHIEHLKWVPSNYLPMDKLKLLPEALAKEKPLADEEQKANEDFLKKVAEAKTQMKSYVKAYKNKQITKEEYINRLHNYLTISDADTIIKVWVALKDCNDNSAIPALIESLKKNVYRRDFLNVYYCFCDAIGNKSMRYYTPASVPDREKLISKIESWWDANKGKNPAEWKSDDLTKFSNLLEGQANSWRPLYDVSGTFSLISGETEDVNNSPVMTVFKRFKSAFLAEDANTILDCLVEPARGNWSRILSELRPELRPKLRDMAEGMKQMVLESENEYKAHYEILSPGEDGKMSAFPVIFVKDEMDNWKISTF